MLVYEVIAYPSDRRFGSDICTDEEVVPEKLQPRSGKGEAKERATYLVHRYHFPYNPDHYYHYHED